MIGFVEESDEIKALRGLRRAAEHYAGDVLSPQGKGEESLSALARAAIVFAMTQCEDLRPTSRKRKKR